MLGATNFNGSMLNIKLIEMMSISINVHSINTSGDDLDLVMKTILEKKPPLLGFYTPKLFELISCQAFKDATDLSFIRSVSVAGAQLSTAMYERIETELAPKITNSTLMNIRK